MQEVRNVPVADIRVGEHALRATDDDESIDGLAASIRRVGVLVPLIVRCEADKYFLIAGHRRYTAAGRAGLAEVPCVVRDSEAAESSEVAFAENIFRKDLSAVEIAAGLKDVLEQNIMNADELARSLHRSTSWIGRMVAMLAWPADVLRAVHDGRLSVSAANNLALVTDDVYRDFLLKNAAESGATARTTAAWLQAWRSMQPPEAAVTAGPGTAGTLPQPAVPQAPCLCCGSVYRMDELSHVPVCVQCIKVVREVGVSR